MKKLCIVCFRWKGSRIPKICDECLEKFAPGFQDEYGVSLFHYQTILRDLIWRGKIHGDLPAISLLVSLFLASDEARGLADWSEIIIPAPSSLWGRIRGKFDIAFHIADKLAKETAKPMENAPGSLFWRLRKRSQHHHEGHQDFARNPPNLNGHRRILIIDDVMTTGQTLHEIAAFYPDDSTKFLTLASASPS